MFYDDEWAIFISLHARLFYKTFYSCNERIRNFLRISLYISLNELSGSYYFGVEIMNVLKILNKTKQNVIDYFKNF